MKNIFVEPDGDPEHFHYTCYVKLNEAVLADLVGKIPPQRIFHTYNIILLICTYLNLDDTACGNVTEIFTLGTGVTFECFNQVLPAASIIIYKTRNSKHITMGFQ